MKKSYAKELLDLGPPHYTKEEYDDCLRQLGRIGRFLGGDKASMKTFRKLAPPETILDIGCGGGQFTLALAKGFPKANVVGIDISSEAIAFAKERLRETSLRNISFEHVSRPHLSYPPNSFDAVTATLVCHHLDDGQLVEFLKAAYRVARGSIVINDLHRHWLPYCLFAPIAKLFFPNRLIFNDGLLSIRRSFTRKEWVGFLKAANIPLERCSIRWHLPFRWVVAIDASSKTSAS